jgi:hypothetical protein
VSNLAKNQWKQALALASLEQARQMQQPKLETRLRRKFA